MQCAIWHQLYNLKNVKNTHGGVLLLVKLEAWRILFPISGSEIKKVHHIRYVSFEKKDVV